MMTSQRVQDSPFRETEWDQKLDRMLDDLKNTVVDSDRHSSKNSSFRSSSRSDSRNSHRVGIEDGGSMKHSHREYTTPDKSTHVVRDEFEYDTGETQSNHYQKKVMKSTYSSYNVAGGLTSDLDDLRKGPDPAVMEEARRQAEIANSEGGHMHPPLPQSDSDTLKTAGSDYSTLTRLHKNIDELDSLLESLDRQERAILSQSQDAISHSREGHNLQVNNHVQRSRSENVLMVHRGHQEVEQRASSAQNVVEQGPHRVPEKFTADISGFDDLDDPSKNSDVRRIVWRNRVEKTYEAQDSERTPKLTVEEDYRRTVEKKVAPDIQQPVPPQVSPGGQSWADPIPLPTPPQLSPKEPGVAYIYTYGQGGTSTVQHLPPLSYVALPGPSSVPTSDGAPSPTPSNVHTTQPIIYHYSYHYTVQPGQPLPEGASYPAGVSSTLPPPALQIASSASQQPSQSLVNYKMEKKSHTTKTTTRTENSSQPYRFPAGTENDKGASAYGPSSVEEQIHPRRGKSPIGSSDPQTNLSITINKQMTRSMHTTDGNATSAPITSTPVAFRRSRSPSPEPRRTRGSDSGSMDTRYIHINHTTHSDSLERLRKPVQENVPFPDTSPIRPTSGSHIPRKVDDLMSSFSDTEDIPDVRYTRETSYRLNGPRKSVEREPLVSQKTTEQELSELRSTEIERLKTKPVAGPPVYYPPGQPMFSETMHTMTLKESKRRGMAKWRAERAEGYKESSAHSESKGGMAMVPVCLPLCCGAACTIM